MATPRAVTGERIRFQLVLAALFPAVLFGMLAVMLVATAMREPSHQFVMQHNAALARAAANRFEGDLATAAADLEAAAEKLATGPVEPGGQATALRAVAPFLRQFEGGVALLDAAGNLLDFTPGYQQGTGYDYPGYVREVQRTRRLACFAVAGPGGFASASAVIATPMPRPGGTTGALVGILSLQRPTWASELAGPAPGPEIRLYILDRQGHELSHSHTGSIDGDLTLDDRLSAALAAGQPQSLVRPEPPYGDQMVISAVPLQGTGWSVVVVEPASQAGPFPASLLWVLATLLASGAVLSAIMVSISITRTIRPLATLAEEAEKLGPGEIFRPLVLEGPLELQTLTDAFNQLMVRIAEQRAMLHEYALQALRSQEDERMRLSRELHDETLQQVVALVQRVELWRSDPGEDAAAQALRLDELHRLASRAVTDLRQISTSLRPPILEHLGLAAAIEAMCDDLAPQMPNARPGSVHFEIVGDNRRLAPELELTAYRVAQEALSNVRKHAHAAAHANATLYFEEWGVLLTVEDDGPGFQVPDTHTLLQAGHLGIAGMFERARLFGGELAIESACGSGTIITLRLPSAA